MRLGADVISVILSGRSTKLRSGLMAIGTMLGFTLMGKSSQEVKDNTEVSVPAIRERQLSKFLNQLNVKELWDLETIGIRDPVENIKSEIQHSHMIERFQKDIKILQSGRYEVALPFKIEGQLRDNRGLTLKRLKRTCKKMGEKNSLKEYASIFEEWEALKIIERVTETEIETNVYYLPHRAVFKISETTKIRPVFDATAREGNNPSLNDCLLKGSNLIELIPDILDRFRMYPIGLSADIEKEIQRIKCKFNPPTAAWWGGWWERLIRVLKDLLKRTLGNAVLTYEELLTVLCDCESIVNSRPLTYVSEDLDYLIPLTPAIFMMSNASLDVTVLDLSEFA
ncbi:integrase catalytic domain-containing protein [Trichonephila clavipes]|uniref:Integrase catalytic domain-containing protein n=1 Tax=Trichonephila clavipes TaxID=2585209 RepID=A0A8X6WKH0_TRICX|nr:integrase catalytic domain-containing protein [Trichonephila clavipes]